jgi:hypothetical protein
MVRADWDAQVVWIVNALAHDPPANANVVKHWGALLDTVPECDIRTTYLIELERYAERFGKRSAEPLAEPSRNRSPNGMPIPEPLTINQLPEPEPEPRHTTRARAHRSAREAATPAVADVVNAITHALAYDESAQLSGKEYARLVASAEEIVGAGGTPAEVPVRAERYARKYPSIAVTHGGLAGHWGELAVEPPARAPPSGSGPPVTFTRQIEANNAAASREFLALMEGTADGSPTVQRQHGSPRGGLPD